MNLQKILIMAAMLIIFSSSIMYAFYDGDTKTNRQESKIHGLIIKFKDDVEISANIEQRGKLNSGIKEIDDLNTKSGITRMTPVVKKGQGKKVKHPLGQVYVLRGEGKSDYNKMIAEYKKLPFVEYVEPDFEGYFLDSPNDPLYSDQWNLYNYGQTHPYIKRNDGDNNDELIYVQGISGSDIKANPVYQDPPENTETVVVALIDSGTDTEHPDLATNIWTNPGETDDGMDNDNNGYVDDINGWYFNLQSNDVSDSHGHGTHCAGIIAAVANNSTGVASVCPVAKIMVLKTYMPTVSTMVEALIYAADMEADVASISIAFNDVSLLLEDAINYANTKGVIIVAASGNDAQEIWVSPADYENVIAVGATTDSDYVWYWSNYGGNLDVVAPGKCVLSLRGSGTDMYGTIGEPNIHIYNSIYYFASGTSMACPHVAGVAAYLKAVSPGIPPSTAETIIEDNADDIIYREGDTQNSYPGDDIHSGHGRVNLQNTIADAPQIRARITSPLPHTITASQSIGIYGIADGSSFQSYTLKYGEGYLPDSWTTISTSYTPVTDGLLGNWTPPAQGGIWTVRLTVNDQNYDMVNIFVVDNATAEITKPEANSLIIKAFYVYGTAYANPFDYYALEYKPAGDPENQYTLIHSSTALVEDEYLCKWITGSLTDGYYDLRLRVVSSAQTVTSDVVQVYVSQSDGDNFEFIDITGEPALTANYSDYDQDDEWEILCGTSSGIYVFNPDGTPKTSGMPTFPSGDFRIPPAVGNFDGDGEDDILAVRIEPTSGMSDIVYGYRTTGGSFQIELTGYDILTPSFYSDSWIYYVILKDINDDDIDEIFIRTKIASASGAKGAVIECRVGQSQATHMEYAESFVPMYSNSRSDYSYYFCDGGQLYEYTTSWSQVRTYSPTINSESPAANSSLLSTCDINNDDEDELIFLAEYPDGVYIWAFDDELTPISGWPRFTEINSSAYPSNPVFGDLDDDGTLEYLIGAYDMLSGSIYAWNVEDGSTYLSGSAVFAVTPCIASMSQPILADINGDGLTDVLANTMNAIFYFENHGQRLIAWDGDGNLLPDFPIEISTAISFSYFVLSPIINDLVQDANGYADLVVPVADGHLFVMNIDGSPFDTCAAPVTMFRYHRNFDGYALSYGPCEGFLCGDVDANSLVNQADVTYIIAYVFQNGPAPQPYGSGDVNGDCTVNVGDAVYLNNYLNNGGAAPLCDCGSGYPKTSDSRIDLIVNYKNGQTTIGIESSIKLSALELTFKDDEIADIVNLVAENIPLKQVSDDQSTRFALVDMKNGKLLEAGQYDIIQLPGECIVSSAAAYDEQGLLRLVKIESSNTILPTEFSFDQNYPNPFNPATAFSFSLPVESRVSLSIYNILGQKIVDVIDEVLPAGTHSATWDG
ncbi:MAG: S8 family serine peptidase, partial [Candidatus Zixiibacteriota bacterium]